MPQRICRLGGLQIMYRGKKGMMSALKSCIFIALVVSYYYNDDAINTLYDTAVY